MKENELKALGEGKATKYVYDDPSPSLLETFPNPMNTSNGFTGEIHIEAPEFTSLCVVGDTMIDVCTDETRNPLGMPIKDLVGQEGYLYSFDIENNCPTVKRFHSVRSTNSSAPVIRVHMTHFKSTGKGGVIYMPAFVDVTPDHLVLVRVGWGKYKWIEAQNLQSGMRLVYSQRGMDTTRGVSRHRLIAEEIYGRLIEKGEIVHHIDHNHFNNVPKNIEIVADSSQHFSHHQKARYGYDDVLDVDDLIRQYNMGESFASLARMYDCDQSTIANRIGNHVQKRTQPEALLIKHKLEGRLDKIKECAHLYEQGYILAELAEFFNVHPTTISGWVAEAGIEVRMSQHTKILRKGITLPVLNHRVDSIEDLGNMPVFNMEVEETSCFFGNGIVLHNCPITNQPDFAKIVIDYIPDEFCVESKSLKLYLGSFRMHGEFHESCVSRICTDLVRLLEPNWIKVQGQFTPRGGIPFWPISEYTKRRKHRQIT